jgi:hypothetical protein
LQVAGKDVANEVVSATVLKGRPGVVLRGAQIDLVELVGPLVAKQGVVQLALAVFLAEEKNRNACLGLVAERLNPPRIRTPASIWNPFRSRSSP